MKSRRRRMREIAGWTILTLVVTLSRLVVWVDSTLGSEPETTVEERR